MKSKLRSRKLCLTAAVLVLIAVFFAGIPKFSVSAQPANRRFVTFLGPMGVTVGHTVRVAFFNSGNAPVKVSVTLVDANGTVLLNQIAVIAVSHTIVSYDWEFGSDAFIDTSGRAEVSAIVKVMTRNIGTATSPGFVTGEIFQIADGKTTASLRSYGWDLDNNG